MRGPKPVDLTMSEIEARSSPEPNTGCWLWTGTLSGGNYARFSTRSVSRAALGLSIGRSLRAPELALHRCDNPPCVNPAHLFVGDHLANMRDMAKKHRHSGEVHGMSILVAADVFAIRARWAEGETQVALAGVFGVANQTISQIVRGKGWTHLPGRHAEDGRKHHSPLSDAAVREIRASGDSNRTLARRYGVNTSTVSRIRSGKRRVCRAPLAS